MKIKSMIAAAVVPLAMISFTACGASQDGCYDDGERVQCGYGDDDDDDDREYDDDDEGWGEDDD